MLKRKIKVLAYSAVIALSILVVFNNIVFAEDAPSAASPATIIVESKPSPIIDVLDFTEVEIADVLKLISQKVSRNIAASQNVKGRITVYLKDVSVLDALKIIVDSYGWAFVEEKDIIKVMTAQEYEEKFGQKFGQLFNTKIYDLNYGNTTSISALLTQVKSPSGKVLVDEKSNTLILIDTPAKLSEMDEMIHRLDVLTVTEVFALNYSKAKDISTEISQVLTPSLGMIKFDERSNRIIVTDTLQVLRRVRDIVHAFDAKHKEVLIQAKIIQIVLDDAHKTGIDWEAVISKFKKLTFISDFNVLSSSDKRGTVSIGTLSDDDFTVLIEALDTIGSTNILSSPRITALNNEEAKILVGSTEPYVTSTTTVAASGPATTSESVNFIDVGVKLFVTPTINNDGFITMKIKPEVSSKTGDFPTSSNNTIPIVETSEAETKVMVKDGVTIILGGLIKEEKIKTDKMVPILGKIPLLGAAFKSNSESLKKTEIAIFLKPTIISGDVSENDINTTAPIGNAAPTNLP
ncbi:MAG: type II secretion system protein GspD [Candidatus Omnitrophica bacterium]|nr:type II secretion system protein GspD [Candidatus Omnitrophota bacterium]